MQKPPEKWPARPPVYAVISLADLLRVEREASASGLSIDEIVRGIIVEQLRRAQAARTVH